MKTTLVGKVFCKYLRIEVKVGLVFTSDVFIYLYLFIYICIFMYTGFISGKQSYTLTQIHFQFFIYVLYLISVKILSQIFYSMLEVGFKFNDSRKSGLKFVTRYNLGLKKRSLQNMLKN